MGSPVSLKVLQERQMCICENVLGLSSSSLKNLNVSQGAGWHVEKKINKANAFLSKMLSASVSI
jgi:hypothetical protein